MSTLLLHLLLLLLPDISQVALETGRRNFKLSGVLPDRANRHQFIVQDCLSYLKHYCGHGDAKVMYDVVVCDPPTVFDSTEKRGIFSCKKDYAMLATHAAQAVRPGGKLVLFCNSHSIKYEKWIGMVEAGMQQCGRPFRYLSGTRGLGNNDLYQLRVSDDFFEGAEEAEGIGGLESDLKGVIIELLEDDHGMQIPVSNWSG